MYEKITYQVTDRHGREWETEEEDEAKKALFNGHQVVEEKLIISLSGAVFTRLFTSTPVCAEHFQEEGGF